MRAKGTGGLLLAAGLAGASGLALESLLVSSSGLALGYGGSAAIGLATWLSAWALGAWCLRRPARSPARTLLALGGALALTTPLSVWVVLQAGDTLAGSAWAAPLALLSIAVPAFLQGAFMPELARRAGSVAALFAANLAGSLLGAWLIADRVAGSLGRPSAALAAAVAAALAGVIGAWSIAGPNTPARGPEGPSAGEISWAASAWIVGLGCAWMAASEWILLRLGVLWLGGMQNALNAVLCATLLALALGAALLPRCLPRGPRGVAALLGLAIAASLWPFAAPALMRATDSGPLFLRAAVLCVPALLPFGALVPVVHASTGLARESGERLGGLLLHEAWGAAIGIPLVHFVVVPSVGLSGAIAVGLGLALLALLPLVFAPSDRRSGLARLAALAALMAGVFVAQRKTPALDTPPFSNPALTVVSVREDRDFAVAVVDDGMIGERTLLTDGFRAAGTGRDYRYMEALGHLPLLLHPAPRRVAVLALGTGTTVGAVALHPEAERIDVLEISRAVVQAAPFFLAKNHGVLAEGLPGLLDERDGQVRIVVRLGDGRAALARSRAHYDVVTMEPLLPDSPFAVYLYTREFYAIARRALLPGGLVCQWVPPHALEPQTFDAVLDAFASSFAWSGAWLFGTQVLLVGADREPALVPARFPTGGGALADSVAALGIGSADDVLLRWCGSLATLAGKSRVLRDADPWIVFRPRRSGAQLLGDLPRNLARLRALPPDPPAAWLSSARPGIGARLGGARDLRAAREAHAWLEAGLRGLEAPTTATSDFATALVRARRTLPGDPELARFDEEVAFLDDLRRGVSALASDRGRDAGELALEPLISAAERRPERADVHLYVAVALERIGSPAAEAVFARALDLCPGLARTSEGARARALGLSDAAWARASAQAGR